MKCIKHIKNVFCSALTTSSKPRAGKRSINDRDSSQNTIRLEDESTASFVDTQGSMEEIASNYLFDLQVRLLKLYAFSEEIDWGDAWITEEAFFEANHQDALAAGDASPRFVSYLEDRKERILNVLWSICRDGHGLTYAEVNRRLQECRLREDRIRDMYSETYIAFRG